MADETRIQTIDLRDAWNAPYKKRAKKAVWIIQEFVKRHAGAKSAKVGTQLNEALWERGAKYPMRTVKVQIIKEKDGVFWAELDGVKFELPKKPEAKKAEKKEEPKAEAAKTEEKKEEPKHEAKHEHVHAKKEESKEEAPKEKKHETHAAKNEHEHAHAKKAEHDTL